MTGDIQSAMRTHRMATSPRHKWSREELTFMLQFKMNWMSLSKEPRERIYFKKNEELLWRLSQKETLLVMSVLLVSGRKEFRSKGWTGKQGWYSIESYTQGDFKEPTSKNWNWLQWWEREWSPQARVVGDKLVELFCEGKNVCHCQTHILRLSGVCRLSVCLSVICLCLSPVCHLSVVCP